MFQSLLSLIGTEKQINLLQLQKEILFILFQFSKLYLIFNSSRFVGLEIIFNPESSINIVGVA